MLKTDGSQDRLHGAVKLSIQHKLLSGGTMVETTLSNFLHFFLLE